MFLTLTSWLSCSGDQNLSQPTSWLVFSRGCLFCGSVFIVVVMVLVMVVVIVVVFVVVVGLCLFTIFSLLL